MQDGLGRTAIAETRADAWSDFSRVEETYAILAGAISPFGRFAAGGPLARLAPGAHAGLGLILLCDHAGNAFPPGYGTLGLPKSEIERHIAYDIGAAGVVRAMAKRLGATAILSRYSRLLIDLNRGMDDPTLIMRLSDGAVVPGNHPIDSTEWDKRIGLYYEPYHRAIDGVITRYRALGVTPVIVSLHSYTEAWKGVSRPWHAGILWARDDRLPVRLLKALRADPGLVVGENQPYSGQLAEDCLDRHATRHGFAHALVEIRQDLITTPAGQRAWADRLCGLLESLLQDPAACRDLAIWPPASAYQAESNHREQDHEHQQT